MAIEGSYKIKVKFFTTFQRFVRTRTNEHRYSRTKFPDKRALIYNLCSSINYDKIEEHSRVDNSNSLLPNYSCHILWNYHSAHYIIIYSTLYFDMKITNISSVIFRVYARCVSVRVDRQKRNCFLWAIICGLFQIVIVFFFRDS